MSSLWFPNTQVFCLFSCHFHVSQTNAVLKNDVFTFVSVVHLARHLNLFKCNYSDWWLFPRTPLCVSASHYISTCLLCAMLVCMKEPNCISSFSGTLLIWLYVSTSQGLLTVVCGRVVLWQKEINLILGQLDLRKSIECSVHRASTCLNWCFCWHADRCQL